MLAEKSYAMLISTWPSLMLPAWKRKAKFHWNTQKLGKILAVNFKQQTVNKFKIDNQRGPLVFIAYLSFGPSVWPSHSPPSVSQEQILVIFKGFFQWNFSQNLIHWHWRSQGRCQRHLVAESGGATNRITAIRYWTVSDRWKTKNV